jgi:hypothetical protein
MTPDERREIANDVAAQVTAAMHDAPRPCSLGLSVDDARELQTFARTYRVMKDRVGAAVVWLMVAALGTVLAAGIKAAAQK